MGNLCGKARRSVTAPRKVHNKATKKTPIPKSMKRLVWDTYVGEDVGRILCLCCKHVYIRQIEFHCGHVISEANGGKISKENLRPICAQCNLSMGTRNMDEFMKIFQ